MTITTKFTETFGVEHPVAQGGMQWVGGTVMGLIDDIPTCGELISRIVNEAEELIGGLGRIVAPTASSAVLA